MPGSDCVFINRKNICTVTQCQSLAAVVEQVSKKGRCHKPRELLRCLNKLKLHQSYHHVDQC